ncbi:unnamed protein product [Phaedon cochleariae]|uniref:Uncharacterized protein n=1 Tax=Phaedon cochleariae TaxID=80249 RepID=A0A9P0DQS0_PHACE|nr:unnamed protein product [Phaedon cochleariae]
MGSSTSSILTDEILEEYSMLTYLSKPEILKLYKTFSTLDENGLLQNLQFRFPCAIIEQLFPPVQFNPFKDRIFKVFSSLKDDKFSFEDMLDFCSVMSENCPDTVKAAWAFNIFDFDEDDEIGENDMVELINRLAIGVGFIKLEDCQQIIKVLLKGINFTTSGTIGPLEFENAIQKMPEFSHSFCFRL